MNRVGKYEKFPVLKAGDVVICGSHNAFIITGAGGYRLRELSDPNQCAELVGFAYNVERLFAECDRCSYPEHIPEAVFRPAEGSIIPAGAISTALTDWRIVRSTQFERIWSIDDDDTKELTVDEVSKLLGYKVKIVGSGISD